ncbi:MAG: hypothetical protein AAFR17_04905 [Pseudomonadota bacterium]
MTACAAVKLRTCLLLLALGTAACETGLPLSGGEPAATPLPAENNEAITSLPEPETGASTPPAGTGSGTTAPLDDTERQIAQAAARAPHIYMAVQPDGGRPISVIFAIDESRDGTPSDDPAIRLTPEDGDCNPQALRQYDFPAAYADQPVFSGDQILLGIPGEQLPNFLAISVTNEVLDLGLASDREETRPLHICTRKLWEAQLANPAGQS